MSGVEYVGRGDWRLRGRPRRQADPDVVRSLRHTYDHAVVGRLTLAADTTEQDVRDTVAELRRAAAELGLHLRLQPRQVRDIIAEGQIRFYGEDT